MSRFNPSDASHLSIEMSFVSAYQILPIMFSFLELSEKMKKFTYAFLSIVAVLTLSSGVNAQLVIDSFNSGTAQPQFGAGLSTGTTTASDILGGQRTDTIFVPNLADGLNPFFGLLNFTDGNFALSQGSNDEVLGALEYDSLNGLDLTGGGAFQSFQLNFTSTDTFIPVTDVLQLSVTSGGTTVFQDVVIPSQDSLGPVTVDFSDFEAEGADLTSVDSVAIGFNFSDNPGRDFQLGSFLAVSAVPEPGSLTIISLAASAMLLRRRRK